jgi:hypothetical protein
VEEVIKGRTAGGLLSDATTEHFLCLTVKELKEFVHARKFDTKTFQESKLVGTDGKLKKTWYSKQTAESIANDCSNKEPCLVWIAWKLRSDEIMLKERPIPLLTTSLPTPEFNVVYARLEPSKLPSQYLNDSLWVKTLKSIVKGVDAVLIDKELAATAYKLALLMKPRLDQHVADRVDESKHNHWTLRFTRDNIPPMAAAMCLLGHVVDDLEVFDISECWPCLPMNDIF